MIKLSKIAIILAGTLFFIHSFIPHSHNLTTKKQEVNQVAKTVTLFGFFSFIIDFDLGENHLNSFINGESEIEKNVLNAVVFIPFFIFFEFLLAQHYFVLQPFSNFSENINLSFASLNANLFRGPPTSFL